MPSPYLCLPAQWLGEGAVDEARAFGGERGVELGDELLGRVRASGGDAENVRDRDEVELRWRELQHRLRARAGRFGADAVELEVEDRVRTVVENDGGDVETFMRLGPQRLDRVHRTAVGFHAHDLAIGARDCGPGRGRQPVADRTAGEREPVVPGR